MALKLKDKNCMISNVDFNQGLPQVLKRAQKHQFTSMKEETILLCPPRQPVEAHDKTCKDHCGKVQLPLSDNTSILSLINKWPGKTLSKEILRNKKRITNISTSSHKDR
jgi:hypothetical protein